MRTAAHSSKAKLAPSITSRHSSCRQDFHASTEAASGTQERDLSRRKKPAQTVQRSDSWADSTNSTQDTDGSIRYCSTASAGQEEPGCLNSSSQRYRRRQQYCSSLQYCRFATRTTAHRQASRAQGTVRQTTLHARVVWTAAHSSTAKPAPSITCKRACNPPAKQLHAC